MVLLDLAGSDWAPLLVAAAIGAVLFLLYRSMRFHLRRIDVPADHDVQPEPDRPRAGSADDD